MEIEVLALTAAFDPQAARMRLAVERSESSGQNTSSGSPGSGQDFAVGDGVEVPDAGPS
ncbi:hypothetical protein AB0L59_28230 [Streptomyces sp. NPDC052109]|uniref:hypothetical protein n=1 Tax=Streptomyces sp. NPDC052109 TaxID=3155527 RepID=UPI00343A50A4